MKQYTKMLIVFILMCLVIATGVKLFFEGCLDQQPQQEAPSLLGSKITKIEAHNYEGDYLIIRINDSNAELEIVVKDEDKYAYQGVKEVHIEQILDELNSFTELFNIGITAEHVEMPRERAMSSDYDILIYLADGRFYLISQVMNAPIQVENKTTHKIMFYLKPYSINYTQPIQEIGAKVFDLQLPIQKKFFESGVTYVGA